MEEITMKVYTVDELSEDARRKAVDNARKHVPAVLCGFDNSDYRDAIEEIEKALNIKVYEWSVDGYNHHFRFHLTDGWTEYEDEERLLLRWLNNVAFPSCTKGKYYSKWSNGKCKVRRSKVLKEPYSCSLTGTWCTIALDDMLNGAMEIVREGKTTIREFISELLYKFFRHWSDDMKYNCSDDAIYDFLICNEYKFLEGGEEFVY